MPGLSQSEFNAILATEKFVSGDIEWGPDQDHSPAVEFLVRVESVERYPLTVRGSYNHEARALFYVLLHRGVGRIYALDLGKDHRNPSTQQLVGDLHKHHWTEEGADREAYRPTDITAGIDDPVAVWRQFCDEAKLIHEGKFATPTPPRGLFDAQ